MITAEQVKEAVLKAGVTEIEDHPCHFCGYMTKFSIVNGIIWYDSGCFCTATRDEMSGEHWETRTWQSIADWINMQDNEEARKMVAGKFGL